MRTVRIKTRWGGLVAAVCAAALAVPLSAMGPAQAVPNKADLSITKTVAVLTPPIAFDPAHRDIGATGHEEWTPIGLRVWTEGWTVTDKVYEHVSTSTPLSAIGEPSLAWTPTSGTIPPGFRLKVDIDGGGFDGVLIGEPTYYGNRWWLSSGSSAAFKLAAPSCNGDPLVGTATSNDLINAGHCTGGNGSAWHGTLDQWRAKFPGATVTAWGFGLGSGVLGDGVITALTFANTQYPLGRSYQSTAQAAPGETVEYKLSVTNSASAGLQATGAVITDTLPADLTYVQGSLVDNGNGCAFSGKTLTCNAGTFPIGFTSTIRFRATLSSTIDNTNLPSTTGHDVSVQKKEVFAELRPNQTSSFTVTCDPGYTATDGSLLVDAVDQGGFYSDIVTLASKPTASNNGWTVTATNFDRYRGQGKVHVTCLRDTLGTSSGHGHSVQFGSPVTVASGPWANASNDNGRTVNVQCGVGERPVAPGFETTSGLLTVRESYAHNDRTWRFVVDHEEDTAATFSVRCLNPQTTQSNGHAATLSLTGALSTVTLGADGRGEAVQQCPGTGHAIVGGYAGYTADVRSLGKEPRGTNYMFRFLNEDWDLSQKADVLVTCVDVRTASEPTYYVVTNSASVSTTALESDTNDNTSSASVRVIGDPPAFAVVVQSTGSRTVTAVPRTKSVDLKIKCEAACSFSVKVLSGATVVAKANKSLAAAPGAKTVKVATTSAGKTLGAGPVKVVVTTGDGSKTYDVTLS